MSDNSCNGINLASLHVLRHHIYEYKKGIRNMVLHTMCSSQRKEVEKMLTKRGIYFFIQEVSSRKINIFFGSPECVDVIKSFGGISLSEYSPEQDFILGIMLGYNSDVQCKRYLRKKSKEKQYAEPYIAYKNVLLSESS